MNLPTLISISAVTNSDASSDDGAAASRTARKLVAIGRPGAMAQAVGQANVGASDSIRRPARSSARARSRSASDQTRR